MINTILFDFGDVFINLDKQNAINSFQKLGLTQWNKELELLNTDFEIGKITEIDFLKSIQTHIPKANLKEIKQAWNNILSDFPLYRLEFLQILSEKYRLFLISNTNSTHIESFEKKVGKSFYSDFYQCFEKVYFSYEIGLRKPHHNIFNFIANNHKIIPKQTLFVDDLKENTDAAASLGFNIWNLKVGQEDVVELLNKSILK